VIVFDEFTFSLRRLWVALCLVLLIDVVLTSSNLTGVPPLHILFAMMPRAIGGAIFLFGPFALAALWLVIVALAIGFHGRRGAGLLATVLLIVPMTYLHWVLVWGCVVNRSCL
jgi:hypothetical protein